MTAVAIDTSFDVRTDTGSRDPDSHSPTLRRYHLLLWSKPLPSGVTFALTEERTDSYLYHRSELGEFFLASDSVVSTLTGWAALQPILREVPAAETEEFLEVVHTIGATMVFPGNKIDGKQTINGARGFHPRIADRMDLTLECIRRHYRNEKSPLAAVLGRHEAFFALFGGFRGYVEFFLLQDLVTDDVDIDGVRYFMPFADFTTPALPRDLQTYREYQRLSIEFVRARNRRIEAWDRSCRRLGMTPLP